MPAARFRVAFFAVVLLQSLLVAPIAAAQPVDQTDLPSRPLVIDLDRAPNLHVIVLSDERLQELDQWIEAFDEWDRWADRWLNRRQRGKWAYALERGTKPDPPAWLEDACGL